MRALLALLLALALCADAAPIVLRPMRGYKTQKEARDTAVALAKLDAAGRKAQFDSWKAAWGKAYPTPADEAKALAAWTANL